VPQSWEDNRTGAEDADPEWESKVIAALRHLSPNEASLFVATSGAMPFEASSHPCLRPPQEALEFHRRDGRELSLTCLEPPDEIVVKSDGTLGRLPDRAVLFGGDAGPGWSPVARPPLPWPPSGGR